MEEAKQIFRHHCQRAQTFSLSGGGGVITQGEYYLLDVLAILRQRGRRIWALASDKNYEETIGVIPASVSECGEFRAIAKNLILYGERRDPAMDPDTFWLTSSRIFWWGRIR